MDCKPRQKCVKIDDKSVRELEYRKMTRMLDKVVMKNSTSTLEMGPVIDEGKRSVDYDSECPSELSEAAKMRQNAKLKTFSKRKSPLQKFDEIVTRELMTRQAEDDDSICFDGKKFSSLDFSCSKITILNKKVTFDTSMSKTALSNASRELKSNDIDPSEMENCALMDAIDKLIQAQASCRFDAAVKAAEAAASSVPMEQAEEVALMCAKDYQSQIIDIINEKIGGDDGRKPIEVIGYIGITKKPPPDEE